MAVFVVQEFDLCGICIFRILNKFLENEKQKTSQLVYRAMRR